MDTNNSCFVVGFAMSVMLIQDPQGENFILIRGNILGYTTNLFNIGIFIINETIRHDNRKTIKLKHGIKNNGFNEPESIPRK